MIHPEATLTEKPNEDLPDEVKKDYLEAASILQKSPRGAAALLRLAIQKLCDSLDTSNKDLNGKIATLVSKGLDVKIQKALDIVRVIGNEAVHPGQIDLNDTPEIAHQLFKLVNLVAQRMISDPSELDEIYSKLPVEQLDAIKKRDQNSRPK